MGARRVTATAFFDLDGCLVDSRAPITTAINHALREHGVATRPAADLEWCIGPPLRASFERLLTDGEADPALADACVAAYRTVYPDLAVATTTPIDGIADILDRLRERVTLGVVTSKPAEYAVPILAAVGLADRFVGLWAPALDALTEPKAAALARAIAAVGATDPVWMVGDRSHDIDAGRSCDVRTVGVLWGSGDREELEAAGADVIVDRPHDLLAAIA